MLAVKASDVVVQRAITGRDIEIACINSESDVVLSGCRSEIQSITSTLRANGIESQKLNVPFAFHSSQVNPILESFRAAADAIKFHSPEVPVISPLLSEVVEYIALGFSIQTIWPVIAERWSTFEEVSLWLSMRAQSMKRRYG